ncbi:hypothetical protein PoB_007074400 [Plakobranchus ocellatus]|uniref:Uncharacterized protein n=1 Tax=Plakobranchus ocellatus TaxID=259542 RepID=A0AAV4DJ50_9GAST|nr:hypothetical protein PoB_007074400 [Plakobranchus ocellatus]
MADNNSSGSMVPEEVATSKKKAMTSAERVRKYREKQKLINPNYSAQESARIEQIRKNRLLKNPEAERRKSRETSAKYRAKKRRAETFSTSPARSGFKSPQGLGRAVKRLQDVLPRSPNKRAQTITGLAKRHGIQLESKMSKELTKRSLTDETI